MCAKNSLSQPTAGHPETLSSLGFKQNRLCSPNEELIHPVRRKLNIKDKTSLQIWFFSVIRTVWGVWTNLEGQIHDRISSVPETSDVASSYEKAHLSRMKIQPVHQLIHQLIHPLIFTLTCLKRLDRKNHRSVMICSITATWRLGLIGFNTQYLLVFLTLFEFLTWSETNQVTLTQTGKLHLTVAQKSPELKKSCQLKFRATQLTHRSLIYNNFDNQSTVSVTFSLKYHIFTCSNSSIALILNFPLFNPQHCGSFQALHFWFTDSLEL